MSLFALWCLNIFLLFFEEGKHLLIKKQDTRKWTRSLWFLFILYLSSSIANYLDIYDNFGLIK